MERMVEELLDHETVNRDEVAKIFVDVPKWEHTESGSLRIQYPKNPVLPQLRQDEEPLAAAKKVDEEAEEGSPSTVRAKKGLRPTGRPADAGA
jgi:hypothetical protein